MTLVIAVTASFNTALSIMTEMSQQRMTEISQRKSDRNVSAKKNNLELLVELFLPASCRARDKCQIRLCHGLLCLASCLACTLGSSIAETLL